jgi:hypothetical protein
VFTLVQLLVGGVVFAVWVAIAVIGLAASALHYAVYLKWVSLPPPNSVIRLRARRQASKDRLRDRDDVFIRSSDQGWVVH